MIGIILHLRAMNQKSIFSIFLFFLLSSFSFAQLATVRGFVYNKKSGEPAIFANVFLKGTRYGVQTDVNGFYSLSKIPPGKYVLSFQNVGFVTFETEIDLTANQILSKNLYVDERKVDLKEFEFSAEKEEKQTETRTSVNTITPKEMGKVPTIGAEPDLAQYLQVLPGITFTGDQGGQLYIRGGSPIQNKVLLDGMTIYNPFHSIGLFSVFDTDIIRNADIYTGGFGAEFGGRISSIMDITTRDGNKKRTSGKISASPFVSKVMVEGPIQKQKENSAIATTYMLSARTSFLEQTSRVIYPYVSTDGIPFNFTDVYGKVSFNSNSGSKLGISAFNFNDQVKYQNLQNLRWNNSGVGANFVLIPNNSAVMFSGSLNYSNYDISLNETSKPARSSSIDGFDLNLNFKYFNQRNEISYGIQMLGFQTKFNFFNEVNRFITQDENTTELGAYFKYKIVTGKWVIEPSFRAHYYASLSELSPEPRISAKVNVTDNFRLKAAGGFYSQNLISAVSDRDVVNLFYGFLSGPDNLPKTFNGNEVTSNLQKARHAILGAEIDIMKGLSLNVEGYYNWFVQLTNINRNKLYDDDATNFDKPEVLKKDFIIENGHSKGLDFLLKYDRKRMYFWAVYSLLYVERFDGIQTYRPHFDRRHNVNLVGSYQFGKGLLWSVNLRWNFGSGFPFTQTQGFVEQPNLNGQISGDYVSNNGNLLPIYGGLNQGRLPTYHRMDINFKRELPISENSIVELTFGATNLYNRQNIFYFDRIKFDRVNQLPILVNFGANWKF